MSTSPSAAVKADHETTAAAAIPRVLTILSYLLEKLVSRNDQLIQLESSKKQKKNGFNSWSRVQQQSGQSRLSIFHGVREPGISLEKYIERLYKYSSCSPSCFVVGYVYIDRLLHKYPHSLLLSLNVHRLLLTSLLIASKILDDVHYNNAFYARVGGVSIGELNKLEIELLFMLDFGVSVSAKVFESYCQHLEKEVLLCSGAPIERSTTTTTTDHHQNDEDITQTSFSPC